MPHTRFGRYWGWVAQECSKCGEIKELDCFGSIGRTTLNGRKSDCKECHQVHYKENRGKSLARMKIYYENNKERYKEYKKAYYQDNKEAADAASRKWAENNPDKAREHRAKSWAKNKPARQAERKAARKRLAMLLSPGGMCESADCPCGLLTPEGKVMEIDHRYGKKDSRYEGFRQNDWRLARTILKEYDSGNKDILSLFRLLCPTHNRLAFRNCRRSHLQGQLIA